VPTESDKSEIEANSVIEELEPDAEEFTELELDDVSLSSIELDLNDVTDEH
jgi:hypothetical protein